MDNRIGKELEEIKWRLEAVEKSGYGEVTVKVADGVVVYYTYSVGEKAIKAEVKVEGGTR